MFNILKKFFNKQFISYLFFGVLTTFVDAFIFYILIKIFLINYLLSTVIAWLFAVVFAYFTNKFWVFNCQKKEKQNIFKEFILFVSLRLASLLISLIFMIFFVDFILIDEFLSKLLVNVVVILLNFIFSKKIIFKNQ